MVWFVLFSFSSLSLANPYYRGRSFKNIYSREGFIRGGRYFEGERSFEEIHGEVVVVCCVR